MPDYLLLNRCAVSLVPKAPFWQWVNQTGEIEASVISEQTTDANLYLIPDFESEADMAEAINNYLLEYFDELFISELEAWNIDPLTYPRVSYALFTEWFDVQIHTMIFDTLKKPLKRN